jgi:hypothetical protein
VGIPHFFLSLLLKLIANLISLSYFFSATIILNTAFYFFITRYLDILQNFAGAKILIVTILSVPTTNS